MDWIHLHLALNHLPVIGLPLVAVLVAIGALRRERWWTRAGLVAVAGLVVAGMLVKVTGDQAAPLTRGAPWHDDSLVNRHEQAADRAATGLFVVGLMAVAGLVASRGGRPVPGWSVIGTLVLVGATGVLLGLTAQSGGHIRHTEIRPGFSVPGR